jgi:hypothetical protein
VVVDAGGGLWLQSTDVAFFAPEVHVADPGFGHGMPCFKQQSPEPAGAPRTTKVHASHLASAAHAASQILALSALTWG